MLGSPDLSKLTVPQLKSLCKEKRISGYSKLGKNALLEKLGWLDPSSASGVASQALSAETRSKQNSGESSKTSDPEQVRELKKGKATKGKATKPGKLVPRVSPLSDRPTPYFEPTTAQTDNCYTTEATICGHLSNNGRVSDTIEVQSTILKSPPVTRIDVSRNSATVPDISAKPNDILSEKAPSELLRPAKPAEDRKRRTVASTNASPKAKKARSETQKKNDCDESTKFRPSSKASGVFKVPEVPRKAGMHGSSLSSVGLTRPVLVSTNSPPPSTSDTLEGTKNTLQHRAAKRFKPLLVKPAPLASVQSNAQMESSVQTYLSILRLLDFPSPPGLPIMPGITFPPSLSKRKQVQRWAVILSQLEPPELNRCVRVSKMMRYAVYLSAYERLAQGFGGKRLALVMQNYAQNRTNMWPYLELRLSERGNRISAYNESFLGKLLSDTRPIESSLWASPNNEKQIVIAVRFVLTRLWFSLSVGGRNASGWSEGVVVDAQETVPGEIWSIVLRYPSRTETLYVLESTCEVVGTTPPVGKSEDSQSKSPVRADWSAYIDQRLSLSSVRDSPPLPLLSHLRWTNHEEYDCGISRLWLKRIAHEGEEGTYKRTVAERYIMACVVANSISGKWMSSTQMAQEFASIPSQVPAVIPRSQRIQLFLPAHHHVESVHFTSLDGSPLHPGLAVVQTPSREYYILKDNGMQVGCEEDGIADVWMAVLGTSNSGSTIAHM